MVAPLVAAAAISAASAIVQSYQAEKARGANDKRLKELRAAFESIVPPEYDISIDDPPRYIEQALPQANLDFSRITPEAFKVIGQYNPQAAEYIQEQAPQLLKGTAAGQEGRQSQIEALREMQKVAKGQSPELAIKLQQASDRSQQEAQSRSQSALQDAQRRGMAGSGLSFATALQGSSDAMQGGATQSQNAAIAAYKDKLSAIQNAGQMGRQLNQDELSMEGRNNDVVNSFNQRTSRAYQDYVSNRAAMQNQAQLYNLGQEQSAADKNVAGRNDAEMFNLQNKNRLTQQGYDNSRSERDYQNNLAQQKANWYAQQKQNQNNLKRQSYQDQMQRANAMTGQTAMQNQNTTQASQDRNATIGSLGNVGSGIFGQMSAQDAQRESQDREEQRWDKYYKLRYGSES